jgi:hypothetical protein
MPRYTRRRILRDLGVASAVGAASVLLPGWKKKAKTAVSSALPDFSRNVVVFL